MFDAEQIEQIYETMTGQLLNSPWENQVENLFAENRECYQLYEEICNLKISIMDRLGTDDEDEALELLICHLLEIGHLQSIAMFHHGMHLRISDKEQ